MERLTIKELAVYLPFKLQWKFEGSDEVHEVMGIDITDFGVHLFSPYGDYGKCRINEGKPLLRPLSSLTEETKSKLSDNGRYQIYIYSAIPKYKLDLFNSDLQILLEDFYDVLGLIDLGLALPIDGKEVEGE